VSAGAVGAIVRKQKQLVAAFRDAGATSPTQAKTLAELGLAAGLAERQLRRHTVLRENAVGALYLDTASWEGLRARRKRWAWVCVALGTMCVVIVLVLSARQS
jgi:IS5 family transposase